MGNFTNKVYITGELEQGFNFADVNMSLSYVTTYYHAKPEFKVNYNQRFDLLDISVSNLEFLDVCNLSDINPKINKQHPKMPILDKGIATLRLINECIIVMISADKDIITGLLSNCVIIAAKVVPMTK